MTLLAVLNTVLV